MVSAPELPQVSDNTVSPLPPLLPARFNEPSGPREEGLLPERFNASSSGAVVA